MLECQLTQHNNPDFITISFSRPFSVKYTDKYSHKPMPKKIAKLKEQLQLASHNKLSFDDLGVAEVGLEARTSPWRWIVPKVVDVLRRYWGADGDFAIVYNDKRDKYEYAESREDDWNSPRRIGLAARPWIDYGIEMIGHEREAGQEIAEETSADEMY